MGEQEIFEKWEAMLALSDTMRTKIIKTPDSYIKKAIYAFLSDWRGTLYAMSNLLSLGMEDTGNAITVLARTAVETTAQLCFIAKDPQTALKKSIYSFLGANYNSFLFNQSLYSISSKTPSWSQRQEDAFQKRQKSCDVLLYEDNSTPEIQAIIHQFQRKISSISMHPHYIYWYKLYDPKIFGPTVLVNKYAFNVPSKKAASFNNLTPEICSIIYNFLSNQAHGLSALINQNYGNLADISFLHKIMMNLFIHCLLVYNEYYPKSAQELIEMYSSKVQTLLAEDKNAY